MQNTPYYKLPVGALAELDKLGRQAEYAAQKGARDNVEALGAIPEPVRAALRAEGSAEAIALAIELIRRAIREYREAVQ